MIKLTATTMVRNGTLTLTLNGEEIESGQIHGMRLDEDKDHVISWFVKGSKGLYYSVSITAGKDDIFFKGECRGQNSHLIAQGSLKV